MSLPSNDKIVGDSGHVTDHNLIVDEINLLKVVTASPVTSTSYTFALNDANKLIEFDNASAITAVIPANSSASFNIGARIDLLQIGAGQVTASAEAGVTLNGYGDATKLSGQWAAASLVKRGTDTWVLIGNITA